MYRVLIRRFDSDGRDAAFDVGPIKLTTVVSMREIYSSRGFGGGDPFQDSSY